jgi:hypothetical protein
MFIKIFWRSAMTKGKFLFLGGLLVIAFMLLATGCDTGNNPVDKSGQEGDDEPITQSRSITVNMQKPAGWPQLYVYAWDDSGTEYTGAAPGTELTDSSGGFYAYNVPSAEYGYINVRFSDGGSHSTLDIQGIESNTYFTSAGAYTGDSSKILIAASSDGSFPASTFTGIPATTTINLSWSFIPDADAYVLYDEVTSWGDEDTDDPSDDWERTYWHLQKALPREQTSLLDDNYGEYLDADTPYSWKLVAIKWNENADFTGISGNLGEVLERDEISELDEQKFSLNYTVIHDFGDITVTTLEGTLPAPGALQILAEELSPASVALQWDPVTGADYYMVWWWNDGSDGRDEGWYYIEAAFDTSYVDADENFIFPNSTYKYLVEARADDHGEGPLYGRWSEEVTITTPAEPVTSLAYIGASSIGRAAAAKQAIPAPSAPKLSISTKGVVTVSITGSSSKNRKFEIYQKKNGNYTKFDTVSGKKATFTKEMKNLTPGASVSIALKELPSGGTSAHAYLTSKYTVSSFSPSSSITVPPKLEAFITSKTTGSGKKAVKEINIAVKGWPSDAVAHYYEIIPKFSSGSGKPPMPTGDWSRYDTYTGTIKTSNKIYFIITPYMGGKAQTALKTGKI